MKLLFEGWREYLKESVAPEDAKSVFIEDLEQYLSNSDDGWDVVDFLLYFLSDQRRDEGKYFGYDRSLGRRANEARWNAYFEISKNIEDLIIGQRVAVTHYSQVGPSNPDIIGLQGTIKDVLAHLRNRPVIFIEWDRETEEGEGLNMSPTFSRVKQGEWYGANYASEFKIDLVSPPTLQDIKEAIL